jgi:THO complex subunit 1
MFQSFPLGDRSSVNLRGNFHVENVTTFEDFLKETHVDQEPMQIDDTRNNTAVKAEAKSGLSTGNPKAANVSKDEETRTMDVDTLYPVFWSLQHSFSNPPRLFEKDHFKQFQKTLEATLVKFKEVPKVLQAAESDRKKGSKARSDDDYDAFASTFNPKYLTSRDLFKLEVCIHTQDRLRRYD